MSRLEILCLTLWFIGIPVWIIGMVTHSGAIALSGSAFMCVGWVVGQWPRAQRRAEERAARAAIASADNAALDREALCLVALEELSTEQYAVLEAIEREYGWEATKAAAHKMLAEKQAARQPATL
jgi:hypothetical protein